MKEGRTERKEHGKNDRSAAFERKEKQKDGTRINTQKTRMAETEETTEKLDLKGVENKTKKAEKNTRNARR